MRGWQQPRALGSSCTSLHRGEGTRCQRPCTALSALPDIPACSPSLPLAVPGSVSPCAAPEQPGTGHQPAGDRRELHHPLRVPHAHPFTLAELGFPTALAALTRCWQCLSQPIHVTPLASRCPTCLIPACRAACSPGGAAWAPFTARSYLAGQHQELGYLL